MKTFITISLNRKINLLIIKLIKKKMLPRRKVIKFHFPLIIHSLVLHKVMRYDITDFDFKRIVPQKTSKAKSNTEKLQSLKIQKNQPI